MGELIRPCWPHPPPDDVPADQLGAMFAGVFGERARHLGHQLVDARPDAEIIPLVDDETGPHQQP